MKQIFSDSALETLSIEIDSIIQLKNQLPDDLDEIVATVINSMGKLIVTGMGKSGHIGRKIAATLASTGTPSFFLHPGEAFHGDLGMISPNDIVLALSYSGETDEILKIIPFLQNNKNVIIGMTGNPNSSLAVNSTFHINIAVEREACILNLAPTSSTTAQLVMGDVLAVCLMKARNFQTTDFARFHPGGSLGRRLLLTVKNVMRKDNLPIVSMDCDIKDVIHEISNGKLGLVVICDNNKVEGIITDGDVRRAMQKREKDFFSLIARDILTLNPKTIKGENKLFEAERLMTQNKINSLVVVNDNEQLEGIIQIYDLKI